MPADNAYSRVIGILKVVLPLTALALLATLFLFARAPVGEGDIPFAEIEDIARESRLTQARISGVTDDGAVFTLSARGARPANGAVTVDGIEARIDATDGTGIEITAGMGTLDTDSQVARLTGLARLETSSGYQMETAGLIADLATGTVTSDGALEIQAPYGTLTAGRVTVETNADGAGARMVFNDGVRLIYQPQIQD
ncbi:MAG: lipopolysaccharide export system permease component LptC [Rhodobacteraceae bacterium HLUCCA08]|nr:MAG: lipopolysaccharide export system permease component LptC [Rhodobacteraceae bacterium HLUCCA08]